MSTIVQKALDGLKKAGAEVTDVVIPGLDDLLRDSSMINSDFKFDLADYLARSENAPVKSLGEILDRGLYHTALEATFRARNAVEQRESEASRRARIKRTAIRQAVEAVLREHRLVALVYPTLRRKPARIGDAQSGTNCQLSAHSGLPALGVPAGFTDDGLPVGIDLLGGAFKEQELLSARLLHRTDTESASAARSARRLWLPASRPRRGRRRRRSTPSIFGLTDPDFGAVLSLSYDESTSRLNYALSIDPPGRDHVSAVWIHAGTVEKPGPARHQLFAAGQPATGTVVLSTRIAETWPTAACSSAFSCERPWQCG